MRPLQNVNFSIEDVHSCLLDAATPGHDDEQWVITQVITYRTSEPLKSEYFSTLWGVFIQLP